jgi:hypothetical protein
MLHVQVCYVYVLTGTHTGTTEFLGIEADHMLFLLFCHYQFDSNLQGWDSIQNAFTVPGTRQVFSLLFLGVRQFCYQYYSICDSWMEVITVLVFFNVLFLPALPREVQFSFIDWCSSTAPNTCLCTHMHTHTLLPTGMHLLGRHSTTWTTYPAPFCFSYSWAFCTGGPGTWILLPLSPA